MTDDRIRALERRFRETGSVEDETVWLRECVRAGEWVVQSLDFGDLKVQERAALSPHGQVVRVLELSGTFDGFEEGPSGTASNYFESLNRPRSTLVHLGQVDYFTDLGPVLLDGLEKSLHKQQAVLLILCPSPPVQEVCDLLGMSYLGSVAEGLQRVEGLR